MLHLLVRLGNDAYAIGTDCVRRVLPFANLKSPPTGLDAVAGVLNYHGRAVPVLDLTRILTGVSSRELLDTRIILADLVLRSGGPSQLLGLLAEGVTSVARFPSFQAAVLRPDGRPWLGPVCEYGHLLVQRIEVASLLPEDILAALARDAESALAT